MASASASVSVIFLLTHLVLLVKAQEQGGQNCLSSFKCGMRGIFSYPFTTIFNPGCGIFILNCTEPVQAIRLGRQGPWYDIENYFANNRTFLVDDVLLQHVGNSDDSCHVFDESFHLPSWPSISITTIGNKTLWKCPKNLSVFDQRNKRGSTNHLPILYCGNYNIYRFKKQENAPSKCWRHVFPDQLIVGLSDQCLQCISDAGHCKDHKNGKFECIWKKGRKKLILLLGLGIPGGSIILILLAMLSWHLRKAKLRLPTFGSRNISAGPTRTDLGRSKMYFTLPIFSYTELEEATNNFDPAMELGDGGFGTVYYGKLKDGREVAVKRLYERNYRQLEQFLNEIEILTCLRHQNLVSLYGCTSRRSRELLLAYEYVPNGTVADHLHGEQAKCSMLTWPIRMSIAIETATALSYLQASDIIHRDVKSNNILLDNNFRVKVADFGLSRLFPTDVTHISTVPQGTPGYLDPEYHQCYQLTGKSDVYSFGIVLIELISSLPAVDVSRNDDEINLSCYAMKRIQCCKFDELIDSRLGFESNDKVKKMAISVAELAFQCLQHKKEFRPSMDEVLEALKAIESADYGAMNVHRNEETDGIPKTQTDADCVYLLRNSEEPSSPNSVMHKWGSSKSITPATSI